MDFYASKKCHIGATLEATFEISQSKIKYVIASDYSIETDGSRWRRVDRTSERETEIYQRDNGSERGRQR